MERRHLLKLLGTTVAFAGWSPARLEALEALEGPRAPARALFTTAQREALTVFADRILPTTDTPGAVEAGVVDYIELIVAEWYEADERARFMRGLEHLDRHAESLSGVRFAHAGEAHQVAILTGMESEGRALREGDPDAPPHFFQQARGLVLHGYYTSEIGMLQELGFVPIPGRYDGDAPVSEIGGMGGGW